MTDKQDFLDEMTAERAGSTPTFPALLDEAIARRKLLRALADERIRQGISQTKLAAAMDTSQSFVARLESSASDTKLSTVERYAASVGLKVEYRLVKAEPS